MFFYDCDHLIKFPPPTFQSPKYFNETEVLNIKKYYFYITISLSFLSLGTNKHSGKCILGQPATLSLKIFWGSMPTEPLEGPKKISLRFAAQNIFWPPHFQKTGGGPRFPN